MRHVLSAATVTLAALLASAAPAAPVVHGVTTIRGESTDYYRWTDSHGLLRYVFLKREGGGNPGHGGYAVRMTYQIKVGNSVKTIVANEVLGEGDGGFGYFVSHERERDFTDGKTGTVAGKIFHKDDSPLGRAFPVSGRPVSTNTSDSAAHRFRLNYPRYGTIDAIPKDENGNDVSATPTDPTKSKLYQLPVTITWIFQNGKDYPRINFRVGLTNVGPDRVNFDLRAPYGVLNFDNGANNNIGTVMWGDRYHFSHLTHPLTRNSTWRWASRNLGARYTALIAGGFEMGLFEPKLFSKSTLSDGFAFGRGLFSTDYTCTDQNEVIPCDWEWPYQSAQYSLSYDDNNEPTSFEKIAWGTSPYWGTGPSMTEVSDTDTTSEPFNGYPSNRTIQYDICVVLGQTITGGLTKSVAISGNYNCATATAP